MKKQQYQESKGYRVSRFWNNEVENNIEGVLEVIRREVEQKVIFNLFRPSGHPLHELGRI